MCVSVTLASGKVTSSRQGFPHLAITAVGDGAMGQLFHAIRTWRDVAIKILCHEAFSHDADRDAEFLPPEKALAFQPMIPAGTERSPNSLRNLG